MKCIRCNKTKLESAFYARDSSCKECRKALVKANRLAKLDYYQAYDRKRGQDPKRKEGVKKRYHELYAGTEVNKKYKQKWLAENREKRKVHIIVGNAIRDGKLVPQPCVRCGKIKGVQGHHEDYSKPLDVMWLCVKHHGERHREINEQRRQQSTIIGTVSAHGKGVGRS